MMLIVLAKSRKKTQMREYIKESSKKVTKDKYFLHNKPVVIVHPFVKDINLGNVIKNVEYAVPKGLLTNVDGFYIGDFKVFSDEGGNFNALYSDGVVYVTNKQDNEEDLVDDIVHEVAHSIEKQYDDVIYGDARLESEFLSKRMTLYHLLDEPPEKMMHYLNPEYDKNFDEYLYKFVGYSTLRNITAGLFYSPYAATSLREYWANGFENYLLKDSGKLKELSPVLYSKIERIYNDAEEKANEYENY